MEPKNAPWHARFAITLALLLPVYFALAALGTKFGLWSWQVGLGSLIIGAGPMLLGIVAALAVVSLILIVRKAPRNGWWVPALAFAVPAGIFAMLASTGGTAEANPIHDVATDTANPPVFSETTMAVRTDSEANPVSDYATPLSQIEWWSERASDELKGKSHAEIVAELYPTLTSLPAANASQEDALEAVKGGMEDLGLSDITVSAEAGTVEGVAETFWFGFKDDVVARVADGKIDFRSVSRVGVSDLGANSKRIMKLRTLVASRLGE